MAALDLSVYQRRWHRPRADPQVRPLLDARPGEVLGNQGGLWWQNDDGHHKSCVRGHVRATSARIALRRALGQCWE
eukprot:1062076-Rhodomonas_salina.1